MQSISCKNLTHFKYWKRKKHWLNRSKNAYFQYLNMNNNLFFIPWQNYIEQDLNRLYFRLYNYVIRNHIYFESPWRFNKSFNHLFLQAFIFTGPDFYSFHVYAWVIAWDSWPNSQARISNERVISIPVGYLKSHSYDIVILWLSTVSMTSMFE